MLWSSVTQARQIRGGVSSMCRRDLGLGHGSSSCLVLLRGTGPGHRVAARGVGDAFERVEAVPSQHKSSTGCECSVVCSHPWKPSKMNSALGRGEDSSKCVVCEEGKIQHPCKLCKAYLYCSKGCCKRDTKKHKQNCADIALIVAGKPDEEFFRKEATLSLASKHFGYLASQATGVEGTTAGLFANDDTKSSFEKLLGAKKDAAAAVADVASALKLREEIIGWHSAATADLASATKKATNLEPENYSDSSYWEHRHAKSREENETYEWYTGYPEEALREAFPRSARKKRTLVVGCGNSELSEKMCNDGFRDVLSIDTSRSAIEMMTRRAPRFNTPRTTCRYQVMDAGRLDGLGTGTFGGVVDKGTIDALLSGNVELARRVCREAMRVLEPGGVFLIISNTSGDKLLGPLLSMCGPGAACDPPLAVPTVDGTSDCVYAYVVRNDPGKPGDVHPAQEQADGERSLRKLGETNTTVADAHEPDDPRRDAVGGTAPRSNSQVADLNPLADTRVTPAVNGVSESNPRSREVGGGGLSPSENGCGGAQSNPRLDGSVSSNDFRRLEQRVREAQARIAEIQSMFNFGGGRKMGVEGTARRSPPEESEDVRTALRSPEPLRSASRSEPVVREEQQPSLPWGAQESFTEDFGCAYYELKFDTELYLSKLSVEIGASRVKACYRRHPEEVEVLIDRELHDKVTSDSTWCIEDKTVLSFSFCKRADRLWHRAFKSLVPEPFAGSGTSEKARGSSARDDTRRPQGSPATPGIGSVKPIPARPAGPRERERSPKASLVRDCSNFKAPERFLLEDQVGIKKLQLYFSKPRGLRVTAFEVSRTGPEHCEVRFSCGGEPAGAGKAGTDTHLCQRAYLGRRDFKPELATCAGAADVDFCVVRVPYGTDHSAEDHEEADDEGVRCIARLRCRFCSHTFTPPGKSLAVRAMPSGRWDECIEDMVCFDGPQAVPILARDVNFARPGRCLISQVAVLLHPRDIVGGAIARVNGPQTAAPKGSRLNMPAEPAEDPGWRSLECKRCGLPLGWPDVSAGGRDDGSGSGAEDDRGLLLLKHCLLGDDVGEGSNGNGVVRDSEDGRDVRQAASGRGDGIDHGAKKVGSALGTEMAPQSDVPPPPPPPPPLSRSVFENRTAVKWLMGQMSRFSDRDGCARFIVSAKGRSPAAPRGSLNLVLLKKDCLLSARGGSKPGWAHRVLFREESREEAERADLEERGEAEPKLERGHEAVGGRGDEERCGKRAAKVPARVLEVTYSEYRSVRERLLQTAWASDSWLKIDPRGYGWSWLF